MAHAAGVRLPFEKLPAAVRAWVERSLGSVVVTAVTQQGGFSPGVAARLVTASGRRAFVKAVGPSLNPKTPSLFRQEITAVQAIGPLPSAPALYDVYDDGDWVGLLFEDISGGFTLTTRDSPQAFQVTPIMVYKVYVDGKPDELVRGVDLIGTPLTSFSKIVAASDKLEVFNGFCGAESGYVPVSAVAPSILTTQIEVQKKAKSSERMPILPSPTGGI